MTIFNRKSISTLALTLGISFGFAGIVDAAPSRQFKGSDLVRPSALALNGPMVAQQTGQERSNEVAPANRGKKANKARRGKKLGHARARRAKRHAKRLATFDANKDGQLDQAEKLSMKKQRFTHLDADGDGSITRKEVATAKQNQRKQRQAQKGNKAIPRHAKRMARKQRRAKRFAKRFAKRDIDKNGSLTWQEFSAPRQKKGRM